MPKNKISEFSSTPANNTDIAGINIAEGCAPSGINNAIRELMAQLKDQQAGTDGDNFAVGGNLTVTGTSELNGATKLFLDPASSTASAPPLSWSSDTNTGIYSPSADTISVATGGTERFRINSSGVLIIGSGEATSTVSGNILRATSGSGTNVVGSNLEITSGNGTGTGGSGNIIFKTADVGSSGSTANTMTQRLLVTPKGGFSFGSGATSYGTTGQVLKSNGDAPPSFGSPITQATAQTASGSSVNFTDIPSWVKRITIQFLNVSMAATGVVRIRLGTSSGLVTTGYSGATTNLTETPTISLTSLSASPEGIGGFGTSSGTTLVNGFITINNITGNSWVSFGNVHRAGDSIVVMSTGSIALSGTLDRISAVATTSTFDAGTINIIYE